MQFYIDIQGHARDVHKQLQNSLKESSDLGESMKRTRERLETEISRCDNSDSARRLRIPPLRKAA